MDVGKRVLGDPERMSILLGICDGLPEVEISGDQHIAFRVRKKTFAYYQDDHHGDGVVCLVCKSAEKRQAELVAGHPERYFVPGYLGTKGWVALRLDLSVIDWPEVEDLVTVAYRLLAPKRLL